MVAVELRSLERKRAALTKDSTEAAQRHSAELAAFRDTIDHVEGLIDTAVSRRDRLIDRGDLVVEDSIRAARRLKEVSDSLMRRERECAARADSIRKRLGQIPGERKRVAQDVREEDSVVFAEKRPLDTSSRESAHAVSPGEQSLDDSADMAFRDDRKMTERRWEGALPDSLVDVDKTQLAAVLQRCADDSAAADSVVRRVRTALQQILARKRELDSLVSMARGRAEALKSRRARLAADSSAAVKMHRTQIRAFAREGQRLESLSRAAELRQTDLAEEKENIERLARERAARRKRLLRKTREELKSLQNKREAAAAERLAAQKRYHALLREEREERLRQDSAIRKARKELTELLGNRKGVRDDSAEVAATLDSAIRESRRTIARYDTLISSKEKELARLRAEREQAREDSLKAVSEYTSAIQQAGMAVVRQADRLETKKKAVAALLNAVEKARENERAARWKAEGALNSAQDKVTWYDSLMAAKRRDLATLDARSAAEKVAEEAAAVRREAQRCLVEIYGRLREDPYAARELLNKKTALLEVYLDPEAFRLLKSSVREACATARERGDATAPHSESAAANKGTTAKTKPSPAGETEPKTEKTAQGPPSPADATVYFSSMPPGARVYIDGRFVGNADAGNLRVRSGIHTVQLVSGGDTCVKRMRFKTGKNPVVFVKVPCK
jgi:DNA repair exonuclease SbcCD ATPase subunit